MLKNRVLFRNHCVSPSTGIAQNRLELDHATVEKEEKVSVDTTVGYPAFPVVTVQLEIEKAFSQ